VHDAGGLVYIDGANMNAIMGITRPGDFGGDMMHYNVHKTFTGPHGAGGPGSGPICVRDYLGKYLPGPAIQRTTSPAGENRYEFTIPEKTIGRVRSFFGNVGILVRGYCYLRTLGPAGVRATAEQAILNANYLKELLADVLPSASGKHCLHEFVASAEQLAKSSGITAMDIAKRLLDFGFHPPTVYFPLVVPQAMMFEPTETESKATLDAFSQAIHQIIQEDAELLHHAPHTAPVSRPEEVNATRKPVLTWPKA
jgi:glycine dehydrogenase subunit 2